jgi:hypothetical protein
LTVRDSGQNIEVNVGLENWVECRIDKIIHVDIKDRILLLIELSLSNFVSGMIALETKTDIPMVQPHLIAPGTIAFEMKGLIFATTGASGSPKQHVPYSLGPPLHKSENQSGDRQRNSVG